MRFLTRTLPFIFAAFCLLLYSLTFSSFNFQHLSFGLSQKQSPIYNETLGFGQIYCINLAYRTDRRDAMHLMSVATGIKLKFIEANTGSNISTKALIGHPDRKLNDKDVRDGLWGCWRSHMDTLNEFIDSGLKTALILEDDVDWDINIKAILSKVSIAIKEMESQKTYPQQGPYGNTWDILYLGNCFEASPNNPKEWPFRIFPDENVPPRDKLSGTSNKLLEIFSEEPDGKRLVMKAQGPVCSFGYAVTRIGAMKLAYHLQTEPLIDALDVHMSILIRTEKVKGYTIIPSVFAPWRSSDLSKNSDLRDDITAVENLDIKTGARDYLGKWLAAQPYVCIE